MTHTCGNYLNKFKRAVHYSGQYLPKYNNMCKYYYNMADCHEIDKFSISIDPYRIHWVNPNRIEKSSRRELPAWREKHTLFGNVSNGDWDIRCEAPISEEYSDREWYYNLIYSEWFEDSILHQSFINRYKKKVQWENTEIYSHLMNGIKQEKKCHYGMESVTDLKNWCTYMDQLYSRIVDRGYLTQFQLKNKRTYKKLLSDEIMVDIGRNGNLLFVDNRHRLSMAKILEIDEVPIVIGVRHQLWMKKIENHDRNTIDIL